MLQNTYTEKDVSVVFKEPGSLNLETAGIMPGLIVLRHSSFHICQLNWDRVIAEKVWLVNQWKGAIAYTDSSKVILQRC